ncbi:hypothetical protein TNCV_1863321 [Trichonephila clavipes]|nr:hypothetical protein TNCV_1863321 [Trichonephila clavipes]
MNSKGAHLLPLLNSRSQHPQFGKAELILTLKVTFGNRRRFKNVARVLKQVQKFWFLRIRELPTHVVEKALGQNSSNSACKHNDPEFVLFAVLTIMMDIKESDGCNAEALDHPGLKEYVELEDNITSIEMNVAYDTSTSLH